MKIRRAARELALDVLYESEIRGRLPLESLAKRKREGWVLAGTGDTGNGEAGEDPLPEVLEYVDALVAGVQEHQADIDALIVKYADHWKIDRMPVIDRNLVRMAVFELLWGPDVPVAVAINEAVELAKSLSTDDSGRFVNGLLGRIVEEAVP